MPGCDGAWPIQSPVADAHDRSRRVFAASITFLDMKFDTKVAIVVRGELASWQKLNVTAFLTGGLAAIYKEIIGERYSDASGQAYGPLIRQPILIFSASAEELRRV